MGHLFQIGAGSGGLASSELVCRDLRIDHLTLVEPDIYQEHNVIRHAFPRSGIGKSKAELAATWLRDRRPELPVDCLACNLLDPTFANLIDRAVQSCDIGIC